MVGTVRKVQQDQVDLPDVASGLAAEGTLESTANKNSPGGYAGLDGSGYVPTGNLPPAVVGALSYQGVYDASGNAPPAVAAPANKGHYYVISVGGTYDGDTYLPGDWTISNGASWDKIDNTEESLPTDVLKTTLASGGISGGILSLTGGIGFQVSAGTGYARTSSDPLKYLTWGTLTGSTLYAGDNWLSISYNGTLNIDSSENQTGDVLRVGYIRTDGTNSVIVGFSGVHYVRHTDFQLNLLNFLRYGVGTRVKNGLAVSEQATPNELKLSISAGSYYLNVQENAFGTQTSFTKLQLTADLGYIPDAGVPLNTVNTGFWNDISQNAGSALIAMTAGFWKKDLVFIVPEGTVYYLYGQAEYATEDDAVKAPYPVIPANIKHSICFLATVVCQQGDLSIATRLRDVRPTVDRFFGSAGYVAPAVATDHGDLTGNGDDDHLQYHNDTRGDTRYYTKTQSDLNYQPKDQDLTDFAGLTPANDDFAQRKAGAWTNRTPTQVTADLNVFVGGAGGAKGLVPTSTAQNIADKAVLMADGTWAYPGKLLQSITGTITQQFHLGTASTNMPFDATIPQITEGVLIYTSPSITPKSTTSKFVVRYPLWIDVESNNQNVTVAAFKDAVANAITGSAMTANVASSGRPRVMSVQFSFTTGSLTAFTLTVRAGIHNTNQDLYINRDINGNNLGGAGVSTIEICEIES